MYSVIALPIIMPCQVQPICIFVTGEIVKQAVSWTHWVHCMASLWGAQNRLVLEALARHACTYLSYKTELTSTLISQHCIAVLLHRAECRRSSQREGAGGLGLL